MTQTMANMAQNNGHITTAQYSISDLIFAEYNPRELTKDQHQDLKDSITRFGLVDPLIVNIHKERKNILVGGHQRLRIAKELGYKSVSCVEVELTPEKEKELNVRLNKNTGQWDWDALANHFDVGELLEWGFSEDELQFTEPDVQGLTDDDDVPEVEEAITKQGDLWLLGEHRVLCGDATKKEDVERLMDGQKIQMLLTDPPYGVDYSSKNEFLNNADKGNLIQKDIINDTKNAEETVEMWRGYFRNVKLNLQSGSNYYINFSGDKLILLLLLLREDDIQMPEKQILVWVKNNHVLGRSNYNYKHEFILYGWSGSKGHKHYGDFDTTVWEIDKPLKNDLHPTMKPIELLVRAIEHGTAKGMSVYDGFLGSGSTLIACEKTNRKCYGMEIDPHYCDVIVKRWEEYTGNKAKRFEAANA